MEGSRSGLTLDNRYPAIFLKWLSEITKNLS